MLALRRAWWRRRAPDSTLDGVWQRPPRSRAPASALALLACDVETSGLDPAKDELLSIGWVPIDGGELLLGGAREHRIRNRQGVGPSATVHGLRDCELEGAGPPEAALAAFVEAAAGRVLVFHHARLDLAFLDRAALSVYGRPLLLPVLDTLRIEARRRRRRGQPLADGDLRLAACRARYGLPVHRPHSALGDALATGELLLAQLAAMGRDTRYGDLR